uniref:Uncharacterized protein n=2 Tax=Meloidogyne incognita TaxID=6306 RepID=A0A914M2P1_MELIC
MSSNDIILFVSTIDMACNSGLFTSFQRINSCRRHNRTIRSFITSIIINLLRMMITSNNRRIFNTSSCTLAVVIITIFLAGSDRIIRVLMNRRGRWSRITITFNPYNGTKIKNKALRFTKNKNLHSAITLLIV